MNPLSRGRRTRILTSVPLLLALVGAGASPAFAEPAPVPTPTPETFEQGELSPDLYGCNGLLRTSTIFLDAKATFFSTFTFVPLLGGAPDTDTTVYIPEHFVGRVTVTVYACQMSPGVWEVKTASAETVNDDVTFEVAGTIATPTSNGYAMFARNVDSNSINLDLAMCAEAPQTAGQFSLSTLRKLSKIPFDRRVTLPLTIGVSMLELAFPSTAASQAYCSGVGAIVSVPYTISSSGYAIPTFPANNRISRSDYYTVPEVCPNARSCSTAYTHSVSVGPRTPTFYDINSFAGEISEMAYRGIVSGYNDGTYRPLEHITREAAAAMVYRAYTNGTDGIGAETCTQNGVASPYVDVDRNSPFCWAIYKLTTMGRISGYTVPGSAAKYFRPQEEVSREAFAAFLYSRSPAVPAGTFIFADVSTSHPLARSIYTARVEGVTTGYPDGTFRGGEAIERQAVAAMLARYLDAHF